MDPLPLVVCGTAAILYALGGRGRLRLWREVSFYSGLALAFVVLAKPFDTWADTWLSVHMTQHVVLMTVVRCRQAEEGNFRIGLELSSVMDQKELGEFVDALHVERRTSSRTKILLLLLGIVGIGLSVLL